MQEGKRLVVIGSSFISMELVAAVLNRNLASIDVIGMEGVPFELVLGSEVGKALMKVRIRTRCRPAAEDASLTRRCASSSKARASSST